MDEWGAVGGGGAMCYCEKRSGGTSKKQENLVIFFVATSMALLSQIVLATHTVGEALFTINRPLVGKIIESRAHR